MMQNEMSTLGDLTIGTRMPLKLVLEMKQLSEARKDKDTKQIEARVKNVFLTCAGRPIEDETEKNIAFYLMLYGGLNLSEAPKLENGELIAIEHEFRMEHDNNKDIKIVGSLSSMFSRFYRYATSGGENASVEQIYAPFTPGSLGKLIPAGYVGKALPLMRLIIKPVDEPGLQPD
jgi:hypothetical protein